MQFRPYAEQRTDLELAVAELQDKARDPDKNGRLISATAIAVYESDPAFPPNFFRICLLKTAALLSGHDNRMPAMVISLSRFYCALSMKRKSRDWRPRPWNGSGSPDVMRPRRP